MIRECDAGESVFEDESKDATDARFRCSKCCALTLPNILILEETLQMVLLLQPAACAISFIGSSPL
jgi:hypothetical protein